MIMWPDYRNAERLGKMTEDVKTYNANHSRLQTLKYISNNYGYTIQAGIRFLKENAILPKIVF